MLETILRTIKTAPWLLIIIMITAACGGASTEEPALSVDEVVALTVAANNAEPALSVDEVVALTVAASNAEPALSVDEVVALTVAASNVQPAEPDVADPNSGIQPIQPASDPNLASGTPQLRVIFSSVNVRNGPGTVYRPISALLKDSVVTVVAKNQNGSWFLIELPGGSRGWVADSVTDPVVAADMAKVTVAATIPAPPSPTATATATATNTPVPTATPTMVATMAVTTTTMATATVTSTPSPTSQTPVTVPITVINNNIQTVCFLSIVPAGAAWGADLLGNDVLINGDQITFNFPPGNYDLLAEDCSANTLLDDRNIPVISGFTWSIP